MLSSPPGWHLREGRFGRSFQELRRAVVSTFLFSCKLESAAKPTGFIHLPDGLGYSPPVATNPGRGHAARLTGLELTPILGLDIDVANLQARHMTAFRERLLAIMLMGYETEFHSQARRARRRGGVPERCPAPQFSQSGRRARSDSIGDQSRGSRTRGTRRCNAFPTHHSQCRPDRGRRTIPFACKARLRGARCRKRGCA